MMKKNVTLLTAVLLLISMTAALSACGSKQEENRKETQASEVTQASQATEAPTTEPASTEPEVPAQTTVSNDQNTELTGRWIYIDGSKELHFDGVNTFRYVEYLEGGTIVNTKGEYWFDGENLNMVDTEGMDLQGQMKADGHLHFAHWELYFVPEGLNP